MMKFAVPVLILFLASSPSQARMTSAERVLAYQKRSELKTPTQTRNVLVRVMPRAQRRLLVTNDLTDNNNELPGPNELDLHSLYARPRISERRKDIADDDELSDYVKVRLAVARAKAMEKYREQWA